AVPVRRATVVDVVGGRGEGEAGRQGAQHEGEEYALHRGFLSTPAVKVVGRRQKGGWRATTDRPRQVRHPPARLVRRRGVPAGRRRRRLLHPSLQPLTPEGGV